MKSEVSYKYAALVLFLYLSGSVLIAQDAEGEQTKKKLQEAVEMEARMERQKAQQAEEMYKRKEMLEAQQQEMLRKEQEYSEQVRIMERSARMPSRTSPYIRFNGTNTHEPFIVGMYGDENQSQLTLRKSFRETTSASEGEFDVESGIRHFRCMISGSVRSGEILILIEYPDGNTFKELTINASADINFSQSVSIKEGEEKKYVGNWYYEIIAEEAEGDYMVQIMTN